MASDTPLQMKFAELQEAEQMHQTSRPKIQKVPDYLRNRNNFEKHYSPKSVSIGPIHLGNQNLNLGENNKLTWAAKYILSTQHTPEFLHKKIAGNIDELKSLYADDVLALANTAESLKGFCGLDEKLSWLLFVDGCFLLHLLVNVNLQTDDQLEYPEFVNIKVDQLENQEHENIEIEDNMKVYKLVLVMMDVLLLENQLPYRVLNLLWKNDDENELIDAMAKFLRNYHWGSLEVHTSNKKTWWSHKKTVRRPDIREKLPNEPPTHLLDLQRKIILITKSNPKANKQSGKYSTLSKVTYRNIQDLTAIGIKLKSSGTRRPLDVDFSEGWFAAKLTLPEIVMDHTSATSFLNLIAFEMCPDFKNDYEISSFVVFMDSLIDHAEDVKKLRSEGILGNYLGRDEEVADLFNTINTELIYNPHTYSEIIAKIHKHRFKKGKIWLALARHTYFSNPWAIIAFLAAFIALALTFVQTWYSVHPAK